MFENLFKIKEGSTLCFTGAGGKTTLMFAVAEEFRNKKILVTTTVKIFNPLSGAFDFSLIGDFNEEIFLNLQESEKNGIYLIARELLQNGKLIGFPPDFISGISKYFYLTLIEGDGSKTKPLKGWNEFEPIVPISTTHTIGILSLKPIGSPMTEDLVHRPEIFKNITGCDFKEIICSSHVKKVIFHKNGLFKNSKGLKILFINCADTFSDIQKAMNFCKDFNNSELIDLNGIIIGSLRNHTYTIFKEVSQ